MESALARKKPTQNNSDKYDSFKIKLVGDAGVGKSSLLSRFADNTFSGSYIPTKGNNFRLINPFIDDSVFKMQIWDTAGRESFRNFDTSSSRCDGLVIVVDVTNVLSVNNAYQYLEEILKSADKNAYLMLAFNKIDLKNVCKIKDDLIERMDCTFKKRNESYLGFIKTSAKNDINVLELFNELSNPFGEAKRLMRLEQIGRTIKEANIQMQANLELNAILRPAYNSDFTIFTDLTSLVDNQDKMIEEIARHIREDENTPERKKMKLESEAKRIIAAIKNDIITTVFPLGLVGGETIILDNGDEKDVPANVKLHWDKIEDAKRGKQSYYDALQDIINQSEIALKTPSKSRRQTTIVYYMKTAKPYEHYALNANTEPQISSPSVSSTGIFNRPNNQVKPSQPVTQNKASSKVPLYFRCPISLDLMKEPVILPSGYTYDKKSLKGQKECPMTRQPFSEGDIIQNRALKDAIDDWELKNKNELPQDNEDELFKGFVMTNI